MFIGRFLFWFVAIFMGFLPVIVGVATTPRHLPSLFALASLVPVYRDFIFSIITVLCIAIIDGSETLMKGKKIFGVKLRPFSIAIVIVCGLICLLCATWSAGERHVDIDDMYMLVYVLSIALLAAFAQRILLLVGDR
jgi:hypothetical protein